MEKMTFLAVLLLAVFICSAGAQSNDVLDRILAEQQLSYAGAAYLAATANDMAEDETPPELMLLVLEQHGIGFSDRNPTDPLNLGEYSYLLMESFDISGGMMYRVLPGPRYATRELAFRGIISGTAMPGKAVTGLEAVRMLEQVLALKEVRR